MRGCLACGIWEPIEFWGSTPMGYMAFYVFLSNTCHIRYATAYVQLGVGLNLKQRQKQNKDEFRCKLHLLTLELINTL